MTTNPDFCYILHVEGPNEQTVYRNEVQAVEAFWAAADSMLADSGDATFEVIDGIVARGETDPDNPFLDPASTTGLWGTAVAQTFGGMYVELRCVRIY